MRAWTSQDIGVPLGERRRSPRFNCGGLAQIICLPSEGLFLPGRIRDLSLGGCGLFLPRPIPCGALAEILVRVNASSFRALGQIKALREPAGICMQFLQMSAGGQDMLVELVRELARQHAMTRRVQAVRRQPDAKFFAEQTAPVIQVGFPARENILAPGSVDSSGVAVNRQSLIIRDDLDLFI